MSGRRVAFIAAVLLMVGSPIAGNARNGDGASSESGKVDSFVIDNLETMIDSRSPGQSMAVVDVVKTSLLSQEAASAQPECTANVPNPDPKAPAVWWAGETFNLATRSRRTPSFT